MNFLRETKEACLKAGKECKDIIFIGSRDKKYRCSWEEFEVLANFEYDDSYGSPKIAQDVVIEFSDKSYLVRGEYDGSEWWEYITLLPESPIESKPIRTFTSKDRVGWYSLEEINR